MGITRVKYPMGMGRLALTVPSRGRECIDDGYLVRLVRLLLGGAIDCTHDQIRIWKQLGYGSGGLHGTQGLQISADCCQAPNQC